MYRNYFLYIYIYLEIIQLVYEILKNGRRKFLKQMCCEEGRVLKAQTVDLKKQFFILFYYYIVLFYYFIVFLREMKQWGILMPNVIERDEEVRYINGSECLFIEICANVYFSFPNSGINIKEY